MHIWLRNGRKLYAFCNIIQSYGLELRFFMETVSRFFKCWQLLLSYGNRRLIEHQICQCLFHTWDLPESHFQPILEMMLLSSDPVLQGVQIGLSDKQNSSKIWKLSGIQMVESCPAFTQSQSTLVKCEPTFFKFTFWRVSVGEGQTEPGMELNTSSA